MASRCVCVQCDVRRDTRRLTSKTKTKSYILHVASYVVNVWTWMLLFRSIHLSVRVWHSLLSRHVRRSDDPSCAGPRDGLREEAEKK